MEKKKNKTFSGFPNNNNFKPSSVKSQNLGLLVKALTEKKNGTVGTRNYESNTLGTKNIFIFIFIT